VLLRGTGDCRFERANDAWGFDGGQEWTAAFSATWERPEARPTLAFGNYLALPLPADNSRSCAPSVLVRPQGDGYGPPQPLEPALCTLSVLFSDWDGTGRHDLRLANDRHYYREGGSSCGGWRRTARPPCTPRRTAGSR
jgi:enediyne biosynthesis protein E4